jgi:tetratricopeptide (TPR) repeat protein
MIEAERSLPNPLNPEHSGSVSAPLPFRQSLLAVLVIVLAGFGAYANSFHGPFVFDDVGSIPENPTIRSLAHAWAPPHGGAAGGLSVAGRPVLNFSLGLNYAVSELGVGSYHALNLAIHLLAGLTLFGVLRRTFLRPVLADRFGAQAWSLALAIAALWTLHPLQTEAVTYVIQRAESLMGLFFLVTLYAAIRAMESPQPGRWTALAVGAGVLGAGTKEIAALAPPLVLLYDRTFVSGSFRDAWQRHRSLHLALAATWLPLLGFLATTGGNRGGTFHLGDASVWFSHALTQFEAVTRYVWLSFVPYPLIFDYGEVPPPSLGLALLWSIPVLALLAATVWALRARPVLGFLGAWVFVILSPTSVLPATLQIIVEHRMYLPLAAVLAGAGAAVHLWLGRKAVPVILILAAGAGVMTFVRNQAYRTAIGLWQDTAEKMPTSARAHNNLGYLLNASGRVPEAIAQFEKALRLDPKYIDAHNNLGSALQDLPGRLDDAIAHYREALRLKPDYPEVHWNLGNAWLHVPDHLNDAVAEYREALRYRPDFAEAHVGLGNAWMKLPGHQNDAIAEFQEALRLKPEYAEAHYSLGNVWLDTPGRLNDAVMRYQEAIRLKSDFAEAHSNLGNAFSAMPGRLNDAVAQYQEAIRLKPDLATAHFNLANAFSALPGRLNDAFAQYQEALRLRPDYAEARYNLGNALMNVPGRLNDVIAQYQQAVRLKPDYVEARVNLGNALYVAGRLNEAVVQFGETLRLRPDFADAHFNLAMALLNLPGRAAEARTHLEAVLRLQPGNQEAAQLLAKLRSGRP